MQLHLVVLNASSEASQASHHVYSIAFHSNNDYVSIVDCHCSNYLQQMPVKLSEEGQRYFGFVGLLVVL